VKVPYLSFLRFPLTFLCCVDRTNPQVWSNLSAVIRLLYFWCAWAGNLPNRGYCRIIEYWVAPAWVFHTKRDVYGKGL